MMHFLLSIIFGWLMYQCYLHQSKYNTAFAILASLFWGLTGLSANRGTLAFLRNAQANEIGRRIVG